MLKHVVTVTKNFTFPLISLVTFFFILFKKRRDLKVALLIALMTTGSNLFNLTV